MTHAAPPLNERVPEVDLRPERGWAALELPELLRFRDLLFILAGRDLKVRYKQTVLGVVWVVLQPLLGAGIFTFVFGMVAGLPGSDYVTVYAGMLAWTAFRSSLDTAANCLVGNAHLISKVYFPRLLLPLSGLGTTLVDFAVGLGMMAVLMAVTGTGIGPRVLALPLVLVPLLALALGAGCVFASLMVFYRDVRYIVPVLMQFLLFASPVGYRLTALEEKVPEALQTLYMLNPLAPLLEAFRWCLLGEGDLDPFFLALSVATSIVVLVVGVFAFRRMERSFADIV